MLEAILHCIPQAGAIVFDDYDKGVVTETLIRAVVDAARRFHIPVIVDPKVENFWNYKDVTLITPNRKEADAVVNREVTNEASLLEVGKIILERLNLQYLLITHGTGGISLFCRGENGGAPRVNYIPAHPPRFWTGPVPEIPLLQCCALHLRRKLTYLLEQNCPIWQVVLLLRR